MIYGDVRLMQEKDRHFVSVLFFFSHLRGRGALCLSSYLTATSLKVTIFKNGLRSAEAFRNENASGADYLDERARGGTLRLGRTALGGYVKFAVPVEFIRVTLNSVLVRSGPSGP